MILINKPLTLNDIEKLNKREISIEVKGHLDNPGLFSIINGSTLADLIPKLQLKSDSNLDAYSVNQRLFDQDVIVVNKNKEKSFVSINSASLEELMTLPGIGESKAQLIINHRQKQRFNHLEDLMKVKGIGDKTFQKLKPLIKL